MISFLRMASALVLAASCSSLPLHSLTAEGNGVVYRVSFPAPQTQHVEITTRFPAHGEQELVVSLPTWRPGRYTILDPAGTLRGFRARSADGQELASHKTAISTWAIETGGAESVDVSYTIYANSLGDRTRHVDPTHAFLSGSSVFLYSPALRSAPVRVEVTLPDSWDIATGLEKAPGHDDVVVAANYDVLVDSPLEIGLHDRVTFTAGGKPHELVIWPPGVERDDERLVEDITKIVETQEEVFGRLPYERYVFLVHAAEAGGGTEHLNSTIMQTSRASIEGSRDEDKAYEGFLGLVAHEFFHTWNVKQLRPAGIHPYDYQHENLSDLLWVCEGTTSYYGALTRARCELTKPAAYVKSLGKAATGLRRSPGTRVQSVAEASRDTWIDSYTPDSANSSVNIYGKGLLVSFCLDMELRKRTENSVSLDNVLRTMFERFPLEGRGYRTEDLLDVLAELSGSSFEDWFGSYVSGTEKLPFEETAGAVGLEFVFEPTEEDDEAKDGEGEEDAGDKTEADGAQESPPDAVPVEPSDPKTKPYLGLRLGSKGSGSVVRTLLADGPSYASGLLVGDEILTLDRHRLTPGKLDDLLEGLEPGQSVHLHVLRHDELLEFDIAIAAIPDGTWVLRKVSEPSDLQRSARESWLGDSWPVKESEEDGAEETEDGTPR